ncbi:uncharacterized protein BCR38DRAFT_345397 [Pseudomassariella vexata]|uniref:Uncharacterized protein n=1 Tax=Pseudomassariella vexata TaxID=1141098 RepID=A0A1Y2DVI0_9PEZI|nr:uncharacterized protein BCR38DRAFT_345397 [Pseudomassariella vexata]ORY63258.1 hypothetical protein BCR38DRAFT_345397 [Pseudomassariella vexata]
MAKTYNTRDSLVVTHPTTNLAVCSLSIGERTGSRVLCNLWSYVSKLGISGTYVELKPPLSSERNTYNKGDTHPSTTKIKYTIKRNLRTKDKD